MKKILKLDISLKLGSYIEKYFPDVKVVYTRKKMFLSCGKEQILLQITVIDLFISIHCDGFKNSKVIREHSVFVMGIYDE